MRTFAAAAEKIMRTLERRRAKILRALRECAAWEKAHHLGELLKSAPSFRKGTTSVTVPDYYDPEMKPVTVPTDPALDRLANAERLFRKARKLKKGAAHQERRLRETEEEIARVRALIEAVGAGKTEEEAARRLLAESGYARFFPEYNRPRDTKPRNLTMRTFISSDGFTIHVGKNAEDNDYITFRLGTGKDIWLHASGWRGSHVLVKVPKGAEVPRRTLRQAAALAVHYSKARGRFRTEVTYAPVHAVRRAARRRPGLVTVSNPRYITSDKKDLDQILPRSAAGGASSSPPGERDREP